MCRFNSETLAKDTDGKLYGDVSAIKIAHFSNDKSSIEADEIFLAIKTNKNDGHDFLADAKFRGASSAIVERIAPNINFPQLQAGRCLYMPFKRLLKPIVTAFKGKVVGRYW